MFSTFNRFEQDGTVQLWRRRDQDRIGIGFVKGAVQV